MKKFEMPELQVIAFEEEPIMLSTTGSVNDATYAVGGGNFTVDSSATPGEFL
mgnify:CR=1 FL=1